MTDNANTHAYGALDIGGTKVAAGVVTFEGRLLARCEALVPKNGSTDDFTLLLRQLLEQCLDNSKQGLLSGIGIAAPGPLDPIKGKFLNPPNLPFLENYPIASKLADIFGVRVELAHDGQANWLGEHRWGAAQDHDDFLFVINGTGTGAAMRGRTLEIGHCSLNLLCDTGSCCMCGCGGHDLLEQFVAGPSIEKRFKELFGITATCRQIAARANDGDEPSQRVLREAGEILGRYLADLRNILQFDLVVVSGGVTESGPFFLEPLEANMRKNRYIRQTKNFRMVKSALGNNIGLYGAAAVLLERHYKPAYL
jgi:glucokinase